jgi:hypothetical protein
MNNYWKGCGRMWKEMEVVKMKYYLGICLEGLRNSTCILIRIVSALLRFKLISSQKEVRNIMT